MDSHSFQRFACLKPRHILLFLASHGRTGSRFVVPVPEQMQGTMNGKTRDFVGQAAGCFPCLRFGPIHGNVDFTEIAAVGMDWVRQVEG